jgi:hypothetical protein
LRGRGVPLMPEMDLRGSPAIPLDFIWFQINGYLGWPHEHNVRRARIARYFNAATIKEHWDYGAQVYVTEPGLPERLAAVDDDFDALIAAGSVVRRTTCVSRDSGGWIGDRRVPWSEQYLALFEDFEGREALFFASGREPFPSAEVTAAGAVLRIIRSIATHHPKVRRGGASVNKAAYLLEKIVKGRYYGKGRIIKNADDTRKKAWEKYKSVAHLAAAFLVFEDYGTAPDMLNIEGIRLFLSIASDFQKFGMSFRPHARRTPLFDYNEIWSVPESLCLPDLPTTVPVAPPLPEAHLAALKNYPG